MARIVSGPYLTGQVTSKQTGAPLAGVTVTVSSAVYTDQELRSGSTTTLTTDGQGIFKCYAKPGEYTFTCSDPSAAPIEAVEVLSPDQGDTAGNATSGNGLPNNYVSKSSAYTAAVNDYVECTTGSGFTVTLPSNPAVGACVAVQKVSGDTNTLTIAPSGSGNIDGDATATTTVKYAGGVFTHKGADVWHYVPIGPTGGVALEGSTAPPTTNTTGSVLGTATTASHADHTHAIGAHDHSTTAKGGLITPTTGLSATGTPSSTTFLRGDNAWATPAGGGNPVPGQSGYATGYYYGCQRTHQTGTSNNGNGLAVYTPFYLSAQMIADRIAIEVTSGGSAGALLRLGVYNANSVGQPGTVLFDAGTVAATGTGLLTITISQTISAGLYFFACVCQGSPATPPTIRTVMPVVAQADPTGTTAVSNGQCPTGYYTLSGITGAFANTPTISGIGTGGAAHVQLRST